MDNMNRVFLLFLDLFVVVRIDNILVYSRSVKDHEDHLKLVLGAVKAHQLFAKLNKCEFWLDEVKFLGHLISQGVMVDSCKIKVVLEWQWPTSVHEMKSFLGLASYYQKFMEGLSRLSSPSWR